MRNPNCQVPGGQNWVQTKLFRKTYPIKTYRLIFCSPYYLFLSICSGGYTEEPFLCFLFELPSGPQQVQEPPRNHFLQVWSNPWLRGAGLWPKWGGVAVVGGLAQGFSLNRPHPGGGTQDTDFNSGFIKELLTQIFGDDFGGVRGHCDPLIGQKPFGGNRFSRLR